MYACARPDVAIINAQRFVLTWLALYFRAASVGCGFLGAAFTRKGVDHVGRALGFGVEARALQNTNMNPGLDITACQLSSKIVEQK